MVIVMLHNLKLNFSAQHFFKLRIVWMVGSLFSLFYYSLAFSTFKTSFSTFHILEQRGQIFKEDFRGFERCLAGFWFGLLLNLSELLVFVGILY